MGKKKTPGDRIREEVDDLFEKSREATGTGIGRCAACGAPMERGECIECGHEMTFDA